MKIIEGLKELKLVDKRLQNNCAAIERYASSLEGEPAFETPAEQEKELNALIQANVDLVTRRSDLRLAIYKTNQEVKVGTPLGEMTIAEAIIMRDAGIHYLANTYKALRDSTGSSQMQALRHTAQSIDPTNPPKVKRYYKETVKNDKLNLFTDFSERIDGVLEVVNAQEELLYI